MGSRSRSSTATTNTDGRTFESFTQSLTDGSVGVSGSGNSLDYAVDESENYFELDSSQQFDYNQEIDNSQDNRAYLDYRQDIDASQDNRSFFDYQQDIDASQDNRTYNTTTVDGGAIDAAESVATFAIDAASGGLLSSLELADSVASMAFDTVDTNNRQVLSTYQDVLSGVREFSGEVIRGTQESLAGAYAEAQSDANQDNQKRLIYVVGASLLAVVAIGAMQK